MSQAFSEVTLLSLQSAIQVSAGYDTLALGRHLAFYIQANGAVTAGKVQFEEAHVANYAGGWHIMHEPIDVPLGAGLYIYKPPAGAFRAVRVRIVDTVLGGTVTVTVQGQKEP